MDAADSPHGVGEAYPAEACDDLLQVDEVDQPAKGCPQFLDDSIYLADHNSGIGLAYDELVGSAVEAVRDCRLPDGYGDMLVQSQGCVYSNDLLLSVGAWLSDSVYEGGLPHTEVLQTVLVIPGVHNYALPPAADGLISPEQFGSLEVLPEHSEPNGIKGRGGLCFVGQLEIGS